MKLRTNWNHGDKVALAKAVGITKQYLSVVLRPDRNTHMSKEVSLGLAEELSAAAMRLGLNLTVMDVLYPERSKNPLVVRTVNRKGSAKKG